jgi:hypothetical protein
VEVTVKRLTFFCLLAVFSILLLGLQAVTSYAPSSGIMAISQQSRVDQNAANEGNEAILSTTTESIIKNAIICSAKSEDKADSQTYVFLTASEVRLPVICHGAVASMPTALIGQINGKSITAAGVLILPIVATQNSALLKKAAQV